uniref:Ribosomal RNA-processing protein 4 n=1 Tax=Tetraselmis chuii TaxID=63592 RepID=A0A7S1SQH6_9CHLO
MEDAHAVLLQAPGGPSEKQFVAVGDTIDTDGLDGFLRGHGTHIVQRNGADTLMATVCGVVERVNKLVSVRPLKSRYSADLGDVVVGRVVEIGGKRWRLDICARQQAQLMLSAVNLPGGLQRRRTAEDELNMRSIFREGDLISAEVQAFQPDGSVALHTRSNKYGKLKGGTLVMVAPNLIKRQKHHFQALSDTGVSMILGCNGLIWVAPTANFTTDADEVGQGDGVAAMDTSNGEAVPREVREAVCRVTNCIRCLSALNLAVHPTAIMAVYKASAEYELGVQDVLDPGFAVRVAEMEVARREQEA